MDASLSHNSFSQRNIYPANQPRLISGQNRQLIQPNGPVRLNTPALRPLPKISMQNQGLGQGLAVGQASPRTLLSADASQGRSWSDTFNRSMSPAREARKHLERVGCCLPDLTQPLCNLASCFSNSLNYHANQVGQNLPDIATPLSPLSPRSLQPWLNQTTQLPQLSQIPWLNRSPRA